MAADNPYFGLLALGDNFIVTGDSVSMIIEIARLGRPLTIAELPRVNKRVLKVLRALGWHEPWGPLLRIGTQAQARDFDGLYAYLYERHLAVRLGEAPHEAAGVLDDDTARVAQRLRQLAGMAVTD